MTPDEARQLAEKYAGPDMVYTEVSIALLSLAGQVEEQAAFIFFAADEGVRMQKELAEVKGQVESLKPDAEKYREVMALKANVSPNEVDEAFDEVAKEQRLEKELAEARTKVNRLEGAMPGFDGENYYLRIENVETLNEVIRTVKAERDALQAKVVEQKALYDAAVEVAYELHSDLGIQEIKRRIAAKLTNAADEGKKSEN